MRASGRGRTQGRAPLWRWLLAALCLLAAHAYLTREPEVGGNIQHARPMAGMVMPGDAPATHPQGTSDLPHDHGAHCPFCFTAAFALAAWDVAVPQRVGEVGVSVGSATPAQRRPEIQHADARAPPT